MSSRALRRAQRELEEKQKLDQLAQSEDDDDEPDQAPQVQRSAFAMLGEVDDEDLDEEDHEDTVESVDGHANAENTTASFSSTQPSQSAKTTKKKRKKKNRSKPDAQATKSDDDLDEIDRALQSLKVAEATAAPTEADGSVAQQRTSEVCNLLAVTQSNLHPGNEMRKLFGRATFDNVDEAPAPARGGRRGQRAAAQAQNFGIAGAVNRQNTRGGARGLAALALRRNLFVQGKESWPNGSSGGLSMEVVNTNPNNTIDFTFTHNQAYQETQVMFYRCVRAMDPEQMIALLREHPYHVATLLQVSEIAKQERDHSTSGDLLERALFTLGRAVHSTFAKAISEGKARLDFHQEENREFWLAVWRYMNNLVMRGTHHTVYEWAKLLLSLSPKDDPYGMHLVMDQYALRAREYDQFLAVYEYSFLDESEIKLTPNMSYSAGLALILKKDLDRARETLRLAVEDFPWLAVRILNELGVDEIPSSIWGNQPKTEYEKLIATLYATRAKDLWSSPEATSFLLDVCQTAKPAKEAEDLGVEIDRNIARHVILSDIPAFISLLPREFTQQVGSASDPLPPLNAEHPYHTHSMNHGSDINYGLGDLLSTIQNGPPRLLAALRNMMAREERQAEMIGVEGDQDAENLAHNEFEGAEFAEIDSILDALMENAPASGHVVEEQDSSGQQTASSTHQHRTTVEDVEDEDES